MTEKNKYNEEMAKKIEEGIKDVLESENFKNFLKTSSNFYVNKYSFSNSFLIYLSDKKASYVMGFEAWKEYGRSVKKGAKALQILAPSFAYEKVEGQLFKTIKASLEKDIKTTPKDSYASYRLGQSNFIFTMQHNGIYSLMIRGKSVARFLGDEDLKKFINNNVLGKVPVYFRYSNVFDVSSTYEPEFLWLKKGKFKEEDLALDENGKPIKTARGLYKVINTEERKSKFNKKLDFSVKAIDNKKAEVLFTCLKNFSEKRGIPLRVEEIKRAGVAGYYMRPNDIEEEKIVISDKLNPTQKVSVTFHEVAHSILHKDLDKLAKKMGLDSLDTHIKEIQAEATAYMSASRFGIDTSTKSFNYLSMHTLGKDLADVKISLEYIHNTSKMILTEIEKELDSLGYTMNLEPKEEIKVISESEELKYSDFKNMKSDLNKCLVSFSLDKTEIDNENELEEDLELEM